MKKIITIIFLSVYLLNLAGTSLYLEYMINKNEKASVSIIDKGEYESEQLVEIKIPLRVPYYSSSAGYERYYGEVNLKGNHYNYVQRKIYNDTVFLLCLPDYTKNKLVKAKTILNAGADNDSPLSTKGEQPLAKKIKFQNEYDQYWSVVKLAQKIFTGNVQHQQNTRALSAAHIEPPVKPPSFKTLLFPENQRAI